MKHLFTLCLILSLSGTICAQSPSENLFARGQFKLSDISTADHFISDDNTEIQANLKNRSLNISGKSYSLYKKGIESYLLDEEKNIHAFLLGRKIKEGKETYLVKGKKLLSPEGEVLCEFYKKSIKGMQLIGISRSKKVSNLVFGLFYYKQLVKIKEGQAHQYGPIYTYSGK